MDQLLQELPVAAPTVSPYRTHQTLRRHGAVRRRDHRLEQAKLEIRQPDRGCAFDADRLQIGIEQDRSGPEGTLRIAAPTPQDRPDAGEQGTRAERLREVVVRAEIETP